MENQWTVPLTDQQHRHEVPPIAERSGPASQPNMPVYQQGKDATTQNCSCVWCSDAQRTQVRPTTEYPVEQQDPRPFGDQNVNTRVKTATVVPDRKWAPLIPSQAARAQENFSYAPAQERAGPPNMGFAQAQPFEATIAEDLKRLANQYLNNPNAHVSTIRLEPGPTGELQIIITLGTANII